MNETFPMFGYLFKASPFSALVTFVKGGCIPQSPVLMSMGQGACVQEPPR